MRIKYRYEQNLPISSIPAQVAILKTEIERLTTIRDKFQEYQEHNINVFKKYKQIIDEADCSAFLWTPDTYVKFGDGAEFFWAARSGVTLGTERYEQRELPVNIFVCWQRYIYYNNKYSASFLGGRRSSIFYGALGFNPKDPHVGINNYLQDDIIETNELITEYSDQVTKYINTYKTSNPEVTSTECETNEYQLGSIAAALKDKMNTAFAFDNTNYNYYFENGVLYKMPNIRNKELEFYRKVKLQLDQLYQSIDPVFERKLEQPSDIRFDMPSLKESKSILFQYKDLGVNSVYFNRATTTEHVKRIFNVYKQELLDMYNSKIESLDNILTTDKNLDINRTNNILNYIGLKDDLRNIEKQAKRFAQNPNLEFKSNFSVKLYSKRYKLLQNRLDSLLRNHRIFNLIDDCALYNTRQDIYACKSAWADAIQIVRFYMFGVTTTRSDRKRNYDTLIHYIPETINKIIDDIVQQTKSFRENLDKITEKVEKKIKDLGKIAAPQGSIDQDTMTQTINKKLELIDTFIGEELKPNVIKSVTMSGQLFINTETETIKKPFSEQYGPSDTLYAKNAKVYLSRIAANAENFTATAKDVLTGSAYKDGNKLKLNSEFWEEKLSQYFQEVKRDGHWVVLSTGPSRSSTLARPVNVSVVYSPGPKNYTERDEQTTRLKGLLKDLGYSFSIAFAAAMVDLQDSLTDHFTSNYLEELTDYILGTATWVTDLNKDNVSYSFNIGSANRPILDVPYFVSDPKQGGIVDNRYDYYNKVMPTYVQKVDEAFQEDIDKRFSYYFLTERFKNFNRNLTMCVGKV